MSKEKRRVPKLRFPGFTEDWEQRKLSDISTKVTTKNVDVHYTETLTNSAEQGIISQVDFFDKEISNKDNINGYYIVDNNDFIYNPRISTLAPVGPINRNKLNRTGIMSPLYTVFRSSNVDLGFLEWYFQSSHWHRYMKLNGDSGVRADRIAIKDSTFFEMPIKIPVNIKEQVLIGETLEKFNQYITLHQRKLDNLKLKKKALLQKLFPKNGERYPELRFPGFTDAWEQRKLNEFLSVSNFKNTENKYNKKDVLSVSGDYGIVNQIDFQGRSFAGASVSNYGVVEKGDIVYTKSPLKLNPYGIIKTNRLNNGIVSTLYAIYKTKENCNSKFIEHYFNLDSRLNQYLKPLVNKGAKNDMKVSSENVLIGEVCFPKITEQALIADFLDCLDIYITLHQRKLDNLKLKKKALLQKLFPKNGERYPELRFPGFTDAWEQRKLNEFLSVSNFKNTENKYNKKDVLSVSGDYGIVNQIDFQGRSFAGASVSNYGVVEKGDIVYTKSPLKLNPYGIIKTNRLNNGIVSTLYAIYKTKENCNSKFIEHYFNLDSRLNQYLKPLVNKGAKNDMKVSSENVLIGEVCFPKITEQALIADFLDCLDIYITLHQRKLEHLKLQKKALLQQMFV